MRVHSRRLRPTVACIAFLALTAPLGAQTQEQTDRQTHTLAIGASGSLELKNVSGDITVTAGSANEARVEVIRRSRGRTSEDARLGLQQVTVDVTHQGERAAVSARYPQAQSDGGQRYSVDITYVVTTPAGTRITAASVSGNIRIERVRGNLEASAVSGDVTLVGVSSLAEVRTVSGDVKASDMQDGDSLSLKSVSGDMWLDRVATRRLEAATTSGEITANAVNSERASLRSISGDITYSGALARAGHYQLQTHSGDVSFAPSGNVGFELRASTFSGRVSSPEGMNAVPNARRQTTAQGTVGDGSATVDITTFSGNVTAGRP